ncbi:MAG: SDR family NAD(P)-dependent oxidoreductase, partial [Planctomycetota bacterium]
MSMQNKVAIVTGGGTGVGRATSLALARLGCHVVVNYSRSRNEAEATVQEIAALGCRALAVQADVADDPACRLMVGTTLTAFGRVDILVNCAGITEFIPFQDLDAVSDETWERLYKVNVVGAFHCARAVREPMLAAGGGVIINVSSVAAQLGQGSSIPYCCTKAALDNLTVSLARTLAPQIRVNGLAPGFIEGRWTQ